MLTEYAASYESLKVQQERVSSEKSEADRKVQALQEELQAAKAAVAEAQTMAARARETHDKEMISSCEVRHPPQGVSKGIFPCHSRVRQAFCFVEREGFLLILSLVAAQLALNCTNCPANKMSSVLLNVARVAPLVIAACHCTLQCLSSN